MRQRKWFLFIGLLALFVQGCSTTTPHQKAEMGTLSQVQIESASEQHQHRLSELHDWQAEGRIAVKQGNKGGNATFVWRQRGEHFDIKLFGPFGSGAVYITGNNQQVQLKEANGKIHTAQSPEALLQKVAGWQVPLSGLRYWLRGLPIPGDKMKKQRLGEGGTLTHFQQDGWIIDYESYHHDNALPLPWKMQLINRKLKVKILVKSWKAH